jgi:regulator of sigma E protease
MRKSIQIIVGLAGLSLVILVHELGHFVACKAFGVGTPVFSIGFGPALLQHKIGQTIFQIAALPLGGYVALSTTDLAAQPYLHQLIIMLAGIAFNFLFAFLVFLFLSARGRYEATTTIDSIVEHSPATKAGLHVGDTVLSLNGESVKDDPKKLLQIILDSPGKQLDMVVDRHGKTIEITITPTMDHPTLGTNSGWIGVLFGTKQIKPRSKKEVLHGGVKGIKENTQNIQQTLKKLFQEEGNSSGIVGPVGIITIAGKSLSYGVSFFFLMLAILSLNIGFFNLLPIPFFDGGQIVALTFIALFGPIPPMLSSVMSRFFLIMLIILVLFLTFKDVLKLKNKKINH